MRWHSKPSRIRELVRACVSYEGVCESVPHICIRIRDLLTYVFIVPNDWSYDYAILDLRNDEWQQMCRSQYSPLKRSIGNRRTERMPQRIFFDVYHRWERRLFGVPENPKKPRPLPAQSVVCDPITTNAIRFLLLLFQVMITTYLHVQTASRLLPVQPEIGIRPSASHLSFVILRILAMISWVVSRC